MELGFDASRSLLWIILLPLAGAVINGIFGRFAERRLVSAVALGSVAGAFLLALFAFSRLVLARVGGEEGARIAYTAYEWFSLTLPANPAAGQSSVAIPIHIRFVMDSLSGVMTLVITGIGLLIHLYSVGYMSEDKGLARFFAYLNLFMASMLILVLASNVPLMFVGWEGVGLCSYLLIGFWFDTPAYAAAGRKAFVVNRIGDFGVLLGMFVLAGFVAVQFSGSSPTTVAAFEFEVINQAASRMHTALPFTVFGIGGSVATVAGLFLFLGCTGKSAQLPLYVWLPDAMAGPTPVSALIHAATMVTAGVYLCCRLSPVFLQSSTVLATIAIVGSLTALMAATIAVVQTDMKKILAYSTVSQLGFMFAAVGVGAFGAAIFHVFTHAFFKACLFLGAGSVMHSVGAHGDADVRKLGGLKHYMPTTRWTFLLSCLAIAGVPLTSGFFSKDAILHGALTMTLVPGGGLLVGGLVFALLAVAATLTAFYMFRLYFLTFEGSYRSAEAESEAHHSDHHHDGEAHAYDPHPHESPMTMTIPLMVLGVGAVVVGYLNLDPLVHLVTHDLHLNYWEHWLDPAVANLSAASLPGVDHEPTWFGYLAAGVGTLAMITGVYTSYRFYIIGGGAPAEKIASLVPRLHRFLFEKWRVDEFYGFVIVRPMKELAKVAGSMDLTFVDGVLTKLSSSSVRLLGWLSVRIQSGAIYVYGAFMALGIVFLTWWFLQPHPQLLVTSQQRSARFEVSPGAGYEYRWDINSDGVYETGWNNDKLAVEYEFGAKDPFHHVLVLSRQIVQPGRAGRGRSVSVMRQELERGGSFVLPASVLPTGWQRRDDSGEVLDGPTPAFEIDGSGVLRVLPNSAQLRVNGRPVTEKTMLDPGSTLTVGSLVIQVAMRISATVEVRNVYGKTSSARADADLVLRRPFQIPRQPTVSKLTLPESAKGSELQ
ncbi:MAG: NADH-quinone oxidoreductase subunit L [Myxococcota bacterium]